MICSGEPLYIPAIMRSMYLFPCYYLEHSHVPLYPYPPQPVCCLRMWNDLQLSQMLKDSSGLMFGALSSSLSRRFQGTPYASFSS